MATTKQRELIDRLANERVVPNKWRGMVHDVVYSTRDLTSAEASGLIGILLEAQRIKRS